MNIFKKLYRITVHPSVIIVISTFFIQCDNTSEPRQTKGRDGLSIELINQHYTNVYSNNINHIFDVTGSDPISVYNSEVKKVEGNDRSRLFLMGMENVQESYFLYQQTNDERLREFAIEYADYLIEIFAQPEGHFVEYEKAPWLRDEDLWFTIPWGTAFSGTEMVESYQLLKNDFNSEQLYRWQKHLANTASWIYKNPVVGSYVFNCTIDLCHVLWKIGKELENEEWKSWALKAAHELIEREIDDEGWIHGEHGVSPFYQLLGSDFLSLFAWDSQDSLLIKTTHQLANTMMQYATPNLYWNGNFGTRSNALGQVGKLPGKHCLMVSAALGNNNAAGLVLRHAEPYWSNKTKIWEEVLTANSSLPEPEPFTEFNGINSYTVQNSGWQAWFNNYEKSLWAKGFTGLWHESLGHVVFSSLHSLPTKVEKAKLRLSDTKDWAGFPHVQIMHKNVSYHSHQRINNFFADTIGHVLWTEPLLSSKGETNGTMKSRYLFNDTLSMEIELSNFTGTATADFHLMRKKDQYFTLWNENQLKSYVFKGKLPEENSREMEFTYGENQQIGIQINNDLFCFEIELLPPGSRIIAGLMQDTGLHTKNHGGAKVRIILPDNYRDVNLRLSFYKITRK